VTGPALLGAAEIRRLAAQLGVRPAKTLGQNFVVDANTVRRIVRTADLPAASDVLEVGPGLGSLTLGLLAEGHRVTAVEIDPRLAGLLAQTAAQMLPAAADRLTVIAADAMQIDRDDLPEPLPTALVANLPYNVAVPVLLGLIERLPTLRTALVMVQAEVARRLAAAPGSRTYGVPSVKLAWYAEARSAGTVPRSVFWPVPHVDSELVSIRRRAAPAADRQLAFSLIDAAFAQRRKSLRAALAGRYGSAAAAERALRAAEIDPAARGEMLSVLDFARLAGVSEHLAVRSVARGGPGGSGGSDFQP
jgi:16S rRNA (adenine1518-N6/adenine1519-N6)-dimethyltransferase